MKKEERCVWLETCVIFNRVVGMPNNKAFEQRPDGCEGFVDTWKGAFLGGRIRNAKALRQEYVWVYLRKSSVCNGVREGKNRRQVTKIMGRGTCLCFLKWVRGDL